MSPPGAPVLVGEHGDIQLVEVLGRGAQATVYRARRGTTEYAVKLLDGSSRHSETELAAFRREAVLLACVDHPALPRIHEVGQADDRPYFVMDLVDGVALSEVLRSWTWDQDRVVALGIDVAGALGAAHRAGVVHRDVKPQNTLVLPSGEARLVDFGLATRIDGEPSESVAGTLIYSAPEVTGMLQRPVDGRSDLYALGAVLFECLTGTPPFSASDVGELIRLHAVAPPPDLRGCRPDVSEGLVGIIERLLAKDPDDRYPDAAALVCALRGLADAAKDGDAVPGGARGSSDPCRLRGRGAPSDPCRSCGGGEPSGLDLPLSGRDGELAALTAQWERARHGRGGIVLVTGPAGGGKSRLARELLHLARAEGRLLLTGKSMPDDAVPLAPLRSAIEEYLHGLDRLPPREYRVAVAALRDAAGPAAGLLGTLSPALAELLPGVERGYEDRQDQFAVAVAAFLVELARRGGGGILCLDDIQWLDPATGKVLRHLAGELSNVPLLVLATSRDDEASLPALAAFEAAVGASVDERLTVAPLDEAGVAELVSAQLPGVSPSAEMVRELCLRSNGNPFTLMEYVRAVIDAGLLRPYWGTWELDVARLDALDLPQDALELVLARIAGVAERNRQMLAVAALIGLRFSAELVAAAGDWDVGAVRCALSEAAERRLLRADGGDYRFLHDRIREALLVELPEEYCRRVHQRLAEILADAGERPTSERVYAAAYHYLAGETRRDPAAVFRACYAAGRLALAEQAPTQALDLLEQAARFIEAAGTAGTSAAGTSAAGVGDDGAGNEFFKMLGIARQRTGRFAEARECFDRALRGENDRVRRAELLSLLAEAHDAAWGTESALDAVRAGLIELGRPLPRSWPVLVGSTLLLFVLSVVLRWTRIGFGTVTGARRERFRLAAALHITAAHAVNTGMKSRLYGVFEMRAQYLASRLGPGPEYARSQAWLGALLEMAGLRRVSRRAFTRAEAVAAAIGDPWLVAEVAYVRGQGVYQNGSDNGETLAEALATHGRWLGSATYLDGAATLAAEAVSGGNTAEAELWYTRAEARHSSNGCAERTAMLTTGIAVPTLRGDAAEVARRMSEARRLIGPNASAGLQVNMLMATMAVAVEQSDVGDEFDWAMASFDALGTRSFLRSHRALHIYEAMGALERCRTVPPEQREQREQRMVIARRAIRRLGRRANSSLLSAYHCLARADLRHLAGQPERALALLAKADAKITRIDAPIVAAETARLRARVLTDLGYRRAAERQAEIALTLATRHGWAYRIDRIRREFGVDSVSPPRAPGGSTNVDVVRHSRQRHRLAAVEQVSLAASRVLDPGELARVALDETIRLLGAERAFLFLTEGAEDRLVPHLGRDNEGNDLCELTGYGSTLVHRVLRTREPLIVTGGEEGAQLGSRSAVVHGLRSIMAAPLLIEGRLFGVVYLDSRVAKGIFTIDDVGVLTAITTHVAVSLETARAAQLELAIQATRRERDVAERLREAMALMSGTLIPRQVLEHLLATATRILPADGGWLLPAAETGETGQTGQAGQAGDDAGAVVGGGGEGTARPPVLDTVGYPVGSWLMIPLRARTDRLGALLLATERPNAFGEAEVQIGAALVDQSMIAYDNARLFARVRHLATADDLTGLPNRRHFFHLAEPALEAARRDGTPFAAIMLDIDHFKRVNDCHGHQIGDEVIQAVAGRLRAQLRDGDVIGRYGGEEFAMILPDTGADAVAIAERLRGAVAGNPVATRAGALPVTISLGVSVLAEADQDVSGLLSRADSALYEAKRRGRDRVGFTPAPIVDDRGGRSRV